MAIREVELNESHRLVFGPKGDKACSESRCPSNTLTCLSASATHQRVFDHVVGPSQHATKVLQVPKFYVDDICDNCIERWESGHADLRAKVWAMLPSAFGLR